MEYTFHVEVISGSLEGLTGEISGKLKADKTYTSQLRSVERKMEEYAAWLTVPRSAIVPALEQLSSWLEYWEEHKGKEVPAGKIDIGQVDLKNDSEQTELFC